MFIEVLHTYQHVYQQILWITLSKFVQIEFEQEGMEGVRYKKKRESETLSRLEKFTIMRQCITFTWHYS